ncbi:hypothetical protein HYX14_04120 [Candidatus Woesearchaeota archaeon]|nr:hypothetical protein [Candidatus Woesearchaeota archaeon]
MLELLLGLTGIAGGMALAKIAPEELEPGEKYFILLQRLLFSVLVIASSVLLMKESRFVVFGLFLIGAVASFIYTIIAPSKVGLIATYLLFLLPSLTLSSSPPLTASLLFLYGLPLGTLLQT